MTFVQKINSDSKRKNNYLKSMLIFQITERNSTIKYIVLCDWFVYLSISIRKLLVFTRFMTS